MKNSSEQLDKLFEALAKAQGEMDFAEKKSLNPHFKSKYADLAAVYEAVREPLSRNGICLIQMPEIREDGKYYLNTVLGHTSGQFISTDLLLLLANQTMQGLGSSVTYAKRYVVSSMTGIAQDDDDGHAAKTGSDGKPKEGTVVVSPKPEVGKEEWEVIASLLEAAKMTKAQLTEYFISEKIDGKNLTTANFHKTCNYLNQRKGELKE